MLRWIGAGLLLAGSVGLGVSGVRRLEQRVGALQAVSAAMELIQCELDFRAPPMRELLETAAAHSSEPAASFLYMCAEKAGRADGKPLAGLWRQCVTQRLAVLRDDEQECLISVGEVLGRYDVQSQRCALIRAREQLDAYLSAAVQERQQKGRVYGALSTAAGTFLVILLL